MVNWSCLGFPFELVPSPDILGVISTATSSSKTMYCLSCRSKNWYFENGEACLCGCMCVLLRYYYAFVLPILENCSSMWGSAGEFPLQLLERQVCSSARLCADLRSLSLCY